MRTLFFCFIAELFSFCPVFAQDQNQITAHFSNGSFEEFVKVAEAKTSCHFFYDLGSTDSLRINLAANNESLLSLLKQVFEGTRFSFSVYHQSIFITLGRELYTSLPSPLFDDDVETTREDKSPIGYI